MLERERVWAFFNEEIDWKLQKLFLQLSVLQWLRQEERVDNLGKKIRRRHCLLTWVYFHTD